MQGFEGLTRQEKDNVLRMLDGCIACIARRCVSDDPLEIVRMISGANRYLSQLACNSLVRIEREKKGCE